MSAAFSDRNPMPRGARKGASAAVRTSRTVRAVASIIRQWIACSTYLPHLQGAAWDRAMRQLCGGALRAFDIEVVADGTAPAARGPLLLVANHVSWIDPYAVNTLHPCRFIAKSEIASWPVFGTIVTGGKSIFIRRGSAREARRVLDAAVAAMRQGDSVGLFAEATSTDGRRLLEFHAALFEAAIEAAAPIYPVAISYETSEGSLTDAAAYWGDITFRESAAAVVGASAIVARLRFCDPISPGRAGRRELARLARGAIGRRLQLPLEAPAGKD